MSAERPTQGERSVASDPSVADDPPAEGSSEEATPAVEGRASAEQPSDQGDPRYASQAAAAEPAPVALESAASAPDGGMTPQREWVFLVLAVFFSIVLVSVPAVLFTGIDLTEASEEDATEGSAAARENERRQLLQETRADALSKLHTYGSTDDGAYRIPVEQAMRLTLQEDYGAASGTSPSGENAAPTSADTSAARSGGAGFLSN